METPVVLLLERSTNKAVGSEAEAISLLTRHHVAEHYKSAVIVVSVTKYPNERNLPQKGRE